ncbi:MAG: hypothetical protein OEY53_05475, partial [Gammaproteobacteria bacterium]|nr:hypothetical protein [Gammaproteobacteria bacterium]
MSSESTATPAPSGLFATIRTRLSNRPDSEHEQALIRLVIAIIVSGYFFTSATIDNLIFQGLSPSFYLCL